MLDFIRKSQIGQALDGGRPGELDSKMSFQLQIKHVVDEKIATFHRDLIRILKPGGVFIHAIQFRR